MSTDPVAFVSTEITVTAGSTLAVQTDVRLFREGEPEGTPVAERHDVRAGTTFAGCVTSWSTARDGLPAPGTKYVVEAQIVVFETTAQIAREAPLRRVDEAGDRTLWSRTLRQAEE